MTDRFDNLNLDELLSLEADLRRERDYVGNVITGRLIAGYPLKIGKAYVIGLPQSEGYDSAHHRAFAGFMGRVIWVKMLRVYPIPYHNKGGFHVEVSGPLRRTKQTNYGPMGGIYTAVNPDVVATRLDLSTEQDP